MVGKYLDVVVNFLGKIFFPAQSTKEVFCHKSRKNFKKVIHVEKKTGGKLVELLENVGEIGQFFRTNFFTTNFEPLHFPCKQKRRLFVIKIRVNRKNPKNRAS